MVCETTDSMFMSFVFSHTIPELNAPTAGHEITSSAVQGFACNLQLTNIMCSKYSDILCILYISSRIFSAGIVSLQNQQKVEKIYSLHT